MIPVFTLDRQNKQLEDEYQEIFQSFLRSGIAILGPKVLEFEKTFAKYIGVKYAVGVASGTDAITLALLALGIKQGDEVILPANVYPSVFGVVASGAIPRLVDVDPRTYTIDPLKIEKAITKKTKAILPVHLYGNPAQMEKIMEISNKHKIAVVEDCAQAVGAEIALKTKVSFPASDKTFFGDVRRLHIRHDPENKETFLNAFVFKRVGSIGDMGCFSFYPTKNLGALGDGGMVVTDNAEIAKRVRLLRMYGEKKRYESVLIGKNSRLDELQAAILLCKMKYLEGWIKRRREIAKIYKSQISNLKCQNQMSNVKSVYHLFVVRMKKRDQLKTYLEKKAIQTGIHYPVAIHLVPSFRYLGYKKGDFPESEKASKEILSLPMFPELRDEEVEKVTKEIQSFSKEK